MDSVGSEPQPILLLETKLNRPAVAADLVNRPRLLNKLADALNRRLTLISAPAGFRKTTLLNQWLHSAPIPAAWLSLDDGDNDLPTFLNCPKIWDRGLGEYSPSPLGFVRTDLLHRPSELYGAGKSEMQPHRTGCCCNLLCGVISMVA